MLVLPMYWVLSVHVVVRLVAISKFANIIRLELDLFKKKKNRSVYLDICCLNPLPEDKF